MPGAFNYEVFGLSVRSDLALPELRSGRDGGPIDLRVDWKRLESADLPPDAVVVDLPSARYGVAGGRRVVVEPRDRALPGMVRLGLLGSALACALHQRGWLCLHAMAFSTGSGAAVVAGPSGVGKSTLAGQLQAHGLEVLCDDLCALEPMKSGVPAVRAGVGRIKLWPDSVRALKMTDADLAAVAERTDKRSLAIAAGAQEAPAILRRFYRLEIGDAGAEPAFERLRGAEAAGAVAQSLYRWPLAHACGRGPDMLAAAVTLAGRCEVFRVTLADDLASLPEAAAALRRHAEGGAEARLVYPPLCP